MRMGCPQFYVVIQWTPPLSENLPCIRQAHCVYGLNCSSHKRCTHCTRVGSWTYFVCGVVGWLVIGLFNVAERGSPTPGNFVCLYIFTSQKWVVYLQDREAKLKRGMIFLTLVICRWHHVQLFNMHEIQNDRDRTFRHPHAKQAHHQWVVETSLSNSGCTCCELLVSVAWIKSVNFIISQADIWRSLL